MSPLLPRLKKLARERHPTGTGPFESFFQFRIGPSAWAVRAIDVIEVLMPATVAPAADLPPGVTGVTNVRGNVIPVLDLRQRWQIASALAAEEDRRLVIVGSRDEPWAFEVDWVNHRLTEGTIEEHAEVDFAGEKWTRFVVEQVLSEEERTALAAVRSRY
jgi:chemotaxis signal transduction protein